MTRQYSSLGRACFVVVIALLCITLVACGGSSGGGGSSTKELSFTRDSFGIPHIVDPDPLNAAYEEGYAVAKDRLYALDVARRQGEGRLAEILGPGVLPQDILARVDGYTNKELTEMVNALPAAGQASWSASVDGINAYIGVVTSKPALLPVEFSRLGYQPQPFTLADLAAAQLGGSGLTRKAPSRSITPLSTWP